MTECNDEHLLSQTCRDVLLPACDCYSLLCPVQHHAHFANSNGSPDVLYLCGRHSTLLGLSSSKCYQIKLPMLDGFSTDPSVSQSCFVFHIVSGHGSKALRHLQPADVAKNFSETAETAGEQLLASEREAAAKAAARSAKKLKQKAKKQHQKEQQKQSIRAEPQQASPAESMHELTAESSPVTGQLELSAMPGAGRQDVPSRLVDSTIGQPRGNTSSRQQAAEEPESSEAGAHEALPGKLSGLRLEQKQAAEFTPVLTAHSSQGFQGQDHTVAKSATQTSQQPCLPSHKSLISQQHFAPVLQKQQELTDADPQSSINHSSGPKPVTNPPSRTDSDSANHSDFRASTAPADTSTDAAGKAADESEWNNELEWFYQAASFSMQQYQEGQCYDGDFGQAIPYFRMECEFSDRLVGFVLCHWLTWQHQLTSMFYSRFCTQMKRKCMCACLACSLFAAKTSCSCTACSTSVDTRVL